MRQSNVIFATLLFAFIIYITIRGQLPSYLDLFKGKGSSSGGSSGASVTPSSAPASGKGNEIDTALAVFDKFQTMFG